MLKINVGFNRKKGEPNYGSRGASVNLELELESGLVKQPDRLRQRVRQLFKLARVAVEEELHTPDRMSQNGPAAAASEKNGHGRASGPPHDQPRRATASQIRALHAIAQRRSMDLDGLLAERFRVTDAGSLSITEASRLIDEISAEANGVGGHR